MNNTNAADLIKLLPYSGTAERVTSYVVLTISGKELGKFILDIDGFFYFMPDTENSGYYSQELLLILSEKLQYLNRKYTESLRTFTVNGIKYSEGSRGPVAVGLAEEE